MLFKVEPQNKLVVELAEKFNIPFEREAPNADHAGYQFCNDFYALLERLGDDGVWDFMLIVDGEEQIWQVTRYDCDRMDYDDD